MFNWLSILNSWFMKIYISSIFILFFFYLLFNASFRTTLCVSVVYTVWPLLVELLKQKDKPLYLLLFHCIFVYFKVWIIIIVKWASCPCPLRELLQALYKLIRQLSITPNGILYVLQAKLTILFFYTLQIIILYGHARYKSAFPLHKLFKHCFEWKIIPRPHISRILLILGIHIFTLTIIDMLMHAWVSVVYWALFTYFWYLTHIIKWSVTLAQFGKVVHLRYVFL